MPTILGTRLGTVLGTDLADTIGEAFQSLFTANDGWYDASNVSGTTLVDYINPARTFPLTAGSISVTASDPDYNGLPSFALTGTQHFTSNQAASYWTPLHSGTGSTLFLVHKPTASDSIDRYVLTSSDVSGASNGIAFLARGPASNFYGWYVCNASGGFAAAPDPLTTLANTPTYFDFQCASGANATVVRKKSATVFTGTLAAPAGGDPSRTLRIGCRSATEFGHFTFRALYYFQRVLTTAERATVQQYIQATTGITP